MRGQVYKGVGAGFSFDVMFYQRFSNFCVEALAAFQRFEGGCKTFLSGPSCLPHAPVNPRKMPLFLGTVVLVHFRLQLVPTSGIRGCVLSPSPMHCACRELVLGVCRSGCSPFSLFSYWARGVVLLFAGFDFPRSECVGIAGIRPLAHRPMIRSWSPLSTCSILRGTFPVILW